ncbi:hypothetical protein NDU88_002970 [Pleurodeles waltl]|uniref:Uncharacterized protein n=1 Tax=Pleurodeles waltl TaxID=8319 RepID=A0AAV7WR20_PLEWA|nr:hypothetical protein NDU88_002970 [Pleurodeles waltl]
MQILGDTFKKLEREGVWSGHGIRWPPEASALRRGGARDGDGDASEAQSPFQTSEEQVEDAVAFPGSVVDWRPRVNRWSGPGAELRAAASRTLLDQRGSRVRPNGAGTEWALLNDGPPATPTTTLASFLPLERGWRWATSADPRCTGGGPVLSRPLPPVLAVPPPPCWRAPTTAARACGPAEAALQRSGRGAKKTDGHTGRFLTEGDLPVRGLHPCWCGAPACSLLPGTIGIPSQSSLQRSRTQYQRTQGGSCYHNQSGITSWTAPRTLYSLPADLDGA